MDSTNNSQKN